MKPHIKKSMGMWWCGVKEVESLHHWTAHRTPRLAYLKWLELGGLEKVKGFR